MSESNPSALNNAADRPAAKRLGKNRDGYQGETIHIADVLTECVGAARAHRWNQERILLTTQEHGQLPLWAFTRSGGDVFGEGDRKRKRVYISAGIHGDEPAGPLAALQLLQEDKWSAELDLWLCPCLNPTGFLLNRRENAQGTDLNRQYLDPTAPETIAHLAWLKRQPGFDLCLCLHEDWEANGFYVYELNPDGRPSLAEKMVQEVAQVCPIDLSEVIEERPAVNGIIRPSIDPRSRPLWPEAFYLLTDKTRLSYTVEAPSDFPLADRVAAVVTAVEAATAAFA